MDFHELISLLAPAFDIDAVAAEASGGLSLRWGGQNTLHIERALAPGLVHLYSPVCPIPQVDPGQLFRLVLEAHTFGYATAGASFGIHRQHEDVLLFQTFALQDFDGDSFAAAMDSFAGQVVFWHNRLMHLPLAPEPSPARYGFEPAPFDTRV